MPRPKIVAMYLPQFHRVQENDEWWGKGFTEWTAVRKARPLFAGHLQPTVPLNKNYYDLLDKDVMEWQANLAKNYGIEAFCIYHYWFKDGKRLLEKPAENLLQWQDIDMPFCFAWDSSSWVRSWSAMEGNAWSSVFDSVTDKQKLSSPYLMEQDFGGEDAWEEHFRYLLPFFKDRRYLQVDGRPVFYFCNQNILPYFERMSNCWQRMAKESGLKGLYLISPDFPSSASSAVVRSMHFTSDKALTDGQFANLAVQEYSSTWEDFLRQSPFVKSTTCWQGMVNFDDTPRRGKRARILLNSTPEVFKKYFAALLLKAIQEQGPLLFLNAWNEWGEGMHLEPDETFGYGWLQAVREIVSLDDDQLVDFLKKSGYHTDFFNWERSAVTMESLWCKEFSYASMLRKWMKLFIANKSLSAYLKRYGYTRIAVYGMGIYGSLLLDVLRSEGVSVVFTIDKIGTACEGKTDIPVYGLSESWPDADLVIISVMEKYAEILEDIEGRTSGTVISVHELIDRALKI